VFYFLSLYQMNKKESISKALKKYIPEEFIPYVTKILFSEKISFRITKPRKTKLGDYRAPLNKDEYHRISINNDLNPYSFLITTLHEFAHMNTYIKYGHNASPHGREWKHEFKKLLLPILESEYLPDDIKQALRINLNNLKASSCTDVHLNRVLKSYNKIDDSLTPLEEIGNDTYFRVGDKVFQRGILRRTRYLCKEVKTGKHYLVSRLADVEIVHFKK